MVKKLLVLIPDRLSDITDKGEVQPSYYNPGQLFDEVHILMTNDDRPPFEPIQYMVGPAKLVLHNYPDDLNLVAKHNPLITPFRLRSWAKGGVEIARQIKPDMIRCHGVDWNTYLASRINAELDIPYVVSIHINLDENPVRRHKGSGLTMKQLRENAFYEYLESRALERASLVMPVYRPILPYLQRKGIKQVEVCYNILDGANLGQKQSYALSNPPRLLYLGRLFGEKNPANIIRAVANMPNVRYTIVGDGPIRPDLETLVSELGVSDRIDFRPTVFNAELCRMMPEYDLFVLHTEYFEVSKSLLEALLTGLPVIMNRRTGIPVPELQSGVVHFVENSVEGYQQAIATMLHNNREREELGRKAYAEARLKYAPEITERKVVDIYKSIIGERHG